jgi:hypothetical protein
MSSDFLILLLFIIGTAITFFKPLDPVAHASVIYATTVVVVVVK